MVRRVDAIFSQRALRPLGPLSRPEGTRVHLSVEEKPNGSAVPAAAKVRKPKLCAAKTLPIS